MPRDLPLSNGRLLVMFDREYRIRDIYFPHVGKENHGTGHVFRFGVWVDGQFGWMGADWSPVMHYADSSMMTEVQARSPKLGVELAVQRRRGFLGERPHPPRPADQPRRPAQGVPLLLPSRLSHPGQRDRRYRVLLTRGRGPAALQGRPLLPDQLQGQRHGRGPALRLRHQGGGRQRRAPGATRRTECSAATPWRRARWTPRSGCR